MPTTLRSFSKINLGLAIGPVRPDNYHALTTLYQTIALHDLVTVSAHPTPGIPTHIRITSTHPRVPVDHHNTAWKMLTAALHRIGVTAHVELHINKRLPIQGGLGAGSANAAASLIALEAELAPHGIARLAGPARLRLAAAVGSDVPLFLLGGAVLGSGRGELVTPLPDLAPTPVPCVVAVPSLGVSTPAAFRAWDARATPEASPTFPLARVPHDVQAKEGLTEDGEQDRLEQLSLAYASSFAVPGELEQIEPGASGISLPHRPERQQGSPEAQAQPEPPDTGIRDLRENPLLSLVRTGMENDFETVVFPQHPPLRDIKRLIVGQDTDSPALYAALSGSGSALFGLFRSVDDAQRAQQRLQNAGTEALLTETLPRARYWSTMVARDRV